MNFASDPLLGAGDLGDAGRRGRHQFGESGPALGCVWRRRVAIENDSAAALASSSWPVSRRPRYWQTILGTGFDERIYGEDAALAHEVERVPNCLVQQVTPFVVEDDLPAAVNKLGYGDQGLIDPRHLENPGGPSAFRQHDAQLLLSFVRDARAIRRQVMDAPQ